jgi:hypothetical protein
MPRTASNACFTDFCTVDGCDETPPPELTTGAFVFVGLGVIVTAFVGGTVAVFVGASVSVGGTGVEVGVGGTDVAVAVAAGTGVAVGGNGVEVDGSVGATVGVGTGVAAVQAVVNKLIIKPIKIDLPSILNIPYLLSSNLTGRRIVDRANQLTDLESPRLVPSSRSPL